VSLGYIPAVERLRLPARRRHPWVLAPWADATSDKTAAARPVRRGLILDLDDTLYPRERFVRSGFAAVARHLAATQGVSADAAYGVLARAREEGSQGHELQALCDHLGLPHDDVPALLDVYRRHMPSIWLSHDAIDALHSLRASGWRLGVLTNGLPSVQFRKVAALGLTSLVDEIIYAEEHVAGGKPAAAAFRAALNALDLTPDHAICVGDNPVNDVAGARAQGIRTIRLATPAATAPQQDDADVVIADITELPAAAALLLGVVTANVA
jgi:putative hydrolase of the HAD superfamily